MSKEELIEVFKDTEEMFKYPGIDKVVYLGRTHTLMYGGGYAEVPDYTKIEKHNHIYEEPALIKVTNRDTLTAAKQYAELIEINRKADNTINKVGVLNFASATTPGGGVTKGSSAQEECLCRCTTLYPALNDYISWQHYYNVNRAANTNFGSDAVLYTPDVLVLKDKDYNRLDDDKMFYVDVITCAAPNLREKPQNQYNSASPLPLTLTDEALYTIHVRRARNILNAAFENGVNYIVLGAFGCGAFKNNPEVVAKAYKDVIPEFLHMFKVIDFAIIDGKYSNNYEVFKRILLQ